MRKVRIILLAFYCISYSQGFAQDEIVNLYKGPAPGSESWDWTEAQMFSDLFGTEVVYNVTDPTLLVFSADESKANGTAIIIAPGGGFQSLSINREGVDLAKELNKRGITAFVLKYRLVETKTGDPAREMMEKLNDREQFNKETAPVKDLAGADIKTAISYLRSNPERYDIDPSKIGVIGFSAGATVVLKSLLESDNPTTVPDFAAAIYGGAGEELIELALPENEIPLFITAASDDQLGLAPHSIDLYNKWLEAGYPVELHMYAKGGHGFGMGRQGLPVDNWYKRYIDWLTQNDYINQPKN